jgi:hypothetical protein
MAMTRTRGLAVNAIVLWNTWYIDASINVLHQADYPLSDEAWPKLSPRLSDQLPALFLRRPRR